MALFRLQANQICFSNQIFKSDCCCRRSDRICVSRHHRPLCCGGDVGTLVTRFPTQKHKEIPAPEAPADTSFQRLSADFYSVWSSVPHSGFDVHMCHIMSDTKDTLKSNLSGRSIQTEAHLQKCDLNLISDHLQMWPGSNLHKSHFM